MNKSESPGEYFAGCWDRVPAEVKDVLSGGDRIIIALSGGADSTFLLEMLAAVFPPSKICCAHLNHLLRGENADRDALLCRKKCEEKCIPYFEKRVDISRISALSKKGTEECGRDERYRFFCECKKRIAAEIFPSDNIIVATAHNCDDNAETVLFNLTRGGGARALKGISPVITKKTDADICGNIVCVRPVLPFSAAEIREALVKFEIPFALDSTNDENDYSRNRIRHRVIPALKEENPRAEEAFYRSSVIAAEDERFLSGIAQEKITEYMRGGKFPSEILSSLPYPVSSRIVVKMFSAVSEEMLSFEHVNSVLSLAGKSGEKKLHLPGHITAYAGKDIYFAREDEKNPRIPEDNSPVNIPLEYGKLIPLPGGFAMYAVRYGENGAARDEDYIPGEGNVYSSLIYEIIINDIINSGICVTNKRDGDRTVIRGHRRRVKKLFCDAGVSARDRLYLPVFRDGDEIIWVPGFPPADRSLYRRGRDKSFIRIKVFGKNTPENPGA